jgi:ribosomal protein S18 acetylase RimI-like enzyme
MQARRGELIDAIGDGGLVAWADGRPVGLVSWHLDREGGGSASGPPSAEITAVVVEASAQGHGVGRALMRGAEQALPGLGVSRVWLVTTNENLAALALYQKVGYRLTALHAGAIDEIRRTIKPQIPLVSGNGIAVHDELELAKDL